PGVSAASADMLHQMPVGLARLPPKNTMSLDCPASTAAGMVWLIEGAWARTATGENTLARNASPATRDRRIDNKDSELFIVETAGGPSPAAGSTDRCASSAGLTEDRFQLGRCSGAGWGDAAYWRGRVVEQWTKRTIPPNRPRRHTHDLKPPRRRLSNKKRHL